MKSKQYKDFFLITPKENGTDEADASKPFNEQCFEISPIPVLYNSRKCLRQRKDSHIEIMTLTELKRAA